MNTPLVKDKTNDIPEALVESQARRLNRPDGPNGAEEWKRSSESALAVKAGDVSELSVGDTRRGGRYRETAGNAGRERLSAAWAGSFNLETAGL
jgi:hypothetical protein